MYHYQKVIEGLDDGRTGERISLVDWTDGRSRSQIVGRGGPKSCEVDVLPEVRVVEPPYFKSCIAECEHR